MGTGGFGGGGPGGNAMVACATTRELAETPSVLARLLVMVLELRVVLNALFASAWVP